MGTTRQKGSSSERNRSAQRHNSTLSPQKGSFFGGQPGAPSLQREEGEASEFPRLELDNRPLSTKDGGFNSTRYRLLPDQKLKLDPSLEMLRSRLAAKGKPDLWTLMQKYPIQFTPPPELARHTPPPPKKRGIGVSPQLDRLIFGPIPDEAAIAEVLAHASSAVAERFKKAIKHLSSDHPTLWIEYRNDGGPPYNPGGGSDQGPTAYLSFYLTYKRPKGLTKLGLTAVDLHTPRPFLPPGEPNTKDGRYDPKGQNYSSITSLDFEVTLLKNRHLKVALDGRVGMDYAKWGKLVQDAIHIHVSNSPLFPWPDQGPKPFVQMGASANLVTPNLAILKTDVYGINFNGRLEFDASVQTGTHRTEAEAGAKVVIRSAAMKTRWGDVRLEYSPIGVFGRGFIRYGDGRPNVTMGAEWGIQKQLMIKLGGVGVGLYGKTTMSTDPSLQTDLPAGSSPVLNPFPNTVDGPSLGGPRGAFHEGGLMISIDLF